MLVITRRVEEGFVLYTKNGPIRVKVVRVLGRSVRFGIDAPDSVDIVRDELVDVDELEIKACSADSR